MKNALRTTLFLCTVFLISACASTSSGVVINEELAARNMESLSQIEVGEQIYYPASDTDRRPELISDRNYLTDSIGSRGGGQQVVKRNPAETVRYGLLINKKGRVDRVIPLDVSEAKILELRESYRGAVYQPAEMNGERVNSYVIITEQF